MKNMKWVQASHKSYLKPKFILMALSRGKADKISWLVANSNLLSFDGKHEGLHGFLHMK